MFFDETTGEVTKRCGPLGKTAGNLTVSPDGRSALFTKADQTGADLMMVEDFR